MRLSIGTFNLNNLFSRWNFVGAIEDLATGEPVGGVTLRYEFTDPDSYRVRTFAGRLVKAKDPSETTAVADWILRMDADVLAVQEVENIAVLREFNADHLGGIYRYAALVEGNDPRFIDVGVLSRFPLGSVTSHQNRVHPASPAVPVFSRDLLEVEVLNRVNGDRMVTLYVNHLKSKFVPFPQDPIAGGAAADARRRLQAESISKVVGERQRPDGRFIVLGDLNDGPESASLEPMLEVEGRDLVDGLAHVTESRPPRPDPGGFDPTSPRWTHRFKDSGLPTRHELFDQIWLSGRLGVAQTGAFIDRRDRLGGDGSDHDPAWITLEL